MKILAIDTSCDDTCCAITEDLKILSNVISSQIKIHQKYGGVYPFLAKREHEKNLKVVLKKALKKAKNPKIDLIGVTIGPGLEPCLWTGINFAKKLKKEWKIPLYPVHHIEGHIIANFIAKPSLLKKKKEIFPAVCLIVSGGHTELILMRDIGSYKILGETRDDAAGECFDKVGRILGFPYPAGPVISKMAKFKPSVSLSLTFPRPMINQKNYDFSFSGLKTAVLYNFQDQPKKIKNSRDYKIEVSREVERAIVEVLTKKTLKAVKDFSAKSIILGGGVAANERLRKEIKKIAKKENLKSIFPPKELCTDNAAMIAGCVYFHHLLIGKPLFKKIEADSNLPLLSYYGSSCSNKKRN